MWHIFVAAELIQMYTSTESQTFTTTSRPVPKSEDPVGEEVDFEVVVIPATCVGATLFVVVVVTMVILGVMMRKAKVGKKVAMSGNTSPIDNSGYISIHVHHS